MNKYTEYLKKPPFYATLYLTPKENVNHGQYSDAIATLASNATLKPGFLGFSEGSGSSKNPVRVIYFDDLIPYTIKLRDIIKSTGCLWKWLYDRKQSMDDTQPFALSA